MKLEPARSFLEAGGRSLQPRTLQLPAPSFYRPAVMRASLELHPKSSMDGSARTLRSSPGFECTRPEERRCATRSRCAARARGVPVSYWAVMRDQKKWIIPTPYACVSAPGAMLAPFTMGPGEYIAFSLLVRR